MRTVYADVVLIVNFAVDYSILYLTCNCLHIKVKLKRLFLASVLGSVFALVVCVINPNSMFSLVLCFFMQYFMCFAAIENCNKKLCIKACVFMSTLSFILNGFVSILTCLFEFSQKLKPIELIISTAVMVCFTARRGTVFSSEVQKRTVKGEITLQGEKKNVELLVDSGNLLFDCYTYLPVVVIKYRLYKDEETEKCKPRFIPVKTVGESGIMKVITPKSISVNNIQISAVLGLCDNGDDFCGCDGIISDRLIHN